MREYAREVAWQGQQRAGVATTAAPQSPQPQHGARSQLFQRASDEMTTFHSGIARQLSGSDVYYFGPSTCKNGNEQGTEARIKELSDEDEEEEER